MVLTQKEISSNLYWLNVKMNEFDLLSNKLISKYNWRSLLKGFKLLIKFNWIGISTDFIKFCYLSLFIKYFYGVLFYYDVKIIGRDNKKVFNILKAKKEVKSGLVENYINTKEELLPYLRKGVDYSNYMFINKEIYYLKNLEIVFNKRLSNQYALFFPILNLKFIVEFIKKNK